MSGRLDTLTTVSLSLSIALGITLAGPSAAHATEAAPASPAPTNAAPPAGSPPGGYPSGGYPPTAYPPPGVYPTPPAPTPSTPWNQPPPPPQFLYPQQPPPGYGYRYEAPPADAAAARRSVRRAGWHTHDGFFLRMSAGLVKVSNTTGGTGPSRSTASGGGVTTGFAIGAAATEHVILYGAFALAAGGTTLHAGDRQVDYQDASFGWLLLGGGLAYYLEPENVFFSATFGATSFSVEDQYNSTVVDSKLGVGTELQVGKEWWLSSSWGLGAAGQFFYSSASDRDSLVGRWTTYGGGLLFSATYN